MLTWLRRVLETLRKTYHALNHSERYKGHAHILHTVCLFTSAANLILTFILLTYFQIGGERGIRTLDTLLEYARFPGVCLQPLGHLSNRLFAST